MFTKALVIGALAPLAALAADVGGALHVGFSAFAAYPTTASDAAAAGWKRSDPGCDPVRAVFVFFLGHFGVIWASFWRHLLHFGVILASFASFWASFWRHCASFWASFSGILGGISRRFGVFLCTFGCFCFVAVIVVYFLCRVGCIKAAVPIRRLSFLLFFFFFLHRFDHFCVFLRRLNREKSHFYDYYVKM
jgi:hypothetical protein